MSNVLVTGGAGYIGSHIVRQLGEAGHKIVVLDDLSSGFRDAVLYGEFVLGDVGDAGLLENLLKSNYIDAVIHLAACTKVEESVKNPLKYYQNNAVKTQHLLRACVSCGVKHFVFSSTAAVYGMPAEIRIAESSATEPINPYGASKLVCEWMIRDTAVAHGLRYVTLRYFNVAGCDPQGRIGQSTHDATLLIKVACEAAVGRRPFMYVFGTDYPTPDGTAVRDYIHVEDLADAHLKALDYLQCGGKAVTLNCGYGHGHSVREVIETTRRISGVDFEVRDAERRAGDPSSLVAEAGRIGELLDWRPRYGALEMIIKTALDWERKLLERRLSNGQLLSLS